MGPGQARAAVDRATPRSAAGSDPVPVPLLGGSQRSDPTIDRNRRRCSHASRARAATQPSEAPCGGDGFGALNCRHCLPAGCDVQLVNKSTARSRACSRRSRPKARAESLRSVYRGHYMQRPWPAFLVAPYWEVTGCPRKLPALTRFPSANFAVLHGFRRYAAIEGRCVEIRSQISNSESHLSL